MAASLLVGWLLGALLSLVQLSGGASNSAGNAPKAAIAKNGESTAKQANSMIPSNATRNSKPISYSSVSMA